MATKIPLRLSKVAGVSFSLSLLAAEHRVGDRGISGQTKQTRTPPKDVRDLAKIDVKNAKKH